MKASSLVFAAVAVSQMGATDCGQVLRDPGFDLWCGSDLCAWKTERGSIKKVATWNEGDPGVQLVDDDTAIEQLSPVSSADGTCIEFDLIANVDPDAQVDLNIDIFGDGTIDHTQPIPTSSWAPLSYRLPFNGTFDGIRFELTKHGSGTAILAQIGAKEVPGGCADFSPITVPPAPNGALCIDDSGCTSGMCNGTICSECKDGTCGSGSTCGAGAPTSPIHGLPHACVTTGATPLGATCYADAECASGICVLFTDQYFANWGACSECDPTGSSCTNGRACNRSWDAPDAPYLCGGGQHAASVGEPCSDDSDCANNHCVGEVRSQCDDGRTCATAVTCPFDDLQNGPCNDVGVVGGSCE
ncbi:MAG: hypothetical protein QM831_34025 [Kofleriaceae bacterium]